MEGNNELTDLQVTNKLSLAKESGQEFKQRRIPEWNENYMLYRDKPQLNRLTQRQSVHIPLMKYAILSAVKDFEKMPSIYFNNLDNDKQKEIFINAYWEEIKKINKLKAKDVMDKKQAALYGRSFKKINVVNGILKIEVIDPMYIILDRYMDPSDIDSAQFLIQTNIYSSLNDLLSMDGLDPYELRKLRLYYKSESGLIDAQNNLKEMQAHKEREIALGIQDAYDPNVDEVYVELNEVYMMLYSNQYGREVMHRLIFACTRDGNHLLSRKELCEVIGHTKGDRWFDHVPYVSWAIDIENGDVWSDGIGDIVRGPNKVVDLYYSQDAENRTLRNFGMNYYDASDPEFVPQTFVPVPWGWYPINGKPQDKVQRIEIPELRGNLEAINFVIGIAEKSVAVNATQQGAVEKSDVTLGEIQLSLANAKERIKDTTISYIESWEDLGQKIYWFIEAAGDSLLPLEVVKKGRNNLQIYKRLISPSDYFSRNGYAPEIKTMEDKQKEDIESIQKLQAAQSIMPRNETLRDITKKKVLEFAGLKPEEIEQVMQTEKQLQTMPVTTIDPNAQEAEVMNDNVPMQDMAMQNSNANMVPISQK